MTNIDADTQLSQYPVSKQDQITKLLEKDIFRVFTLEEISSNIQVFKPRFINEIKNLCTNKTYEKICLAEQAHNNQNKNLILT